MKQTFLLFILAFIGKPFMEFESIVRVNKLNIVARKSLFSTILGQDLGI